MSRGMCTCAPPCTVAVPGLSGVSSNGCECSPLQMLNRILLAAPGITNSRMSASKCEDQHITILIVTLLKPPQVVTHNRTPNTQ